MAPAPQATPTANAPTAAASEAIPPFGNPIDVLAVIDFARNSPSPPQQAFGLWDPEAESTWTAGTESGFTVKMPTFGGPHDATRLALELNLDPFVAFPLRMRQSLDIAVNGQQIGTVQVQSAATLTFYLPESCNAAGSLAVVLTHPDAASPADLRGEADNRLLAFALREALVLRVPAPAQITPRNRPSLPATHASDEAALAAQVRAITGLGPDGVMMAMESLGFNCEFGIAQRRSGADPLGLLRFVGVDMHKLLAGLDQGFAGIDDPASLIVYLNESERAEYMAQQRLYGIVFHTFRFAEETTEATVRTEILRNLTFYRRKFLEVLRSGEKLFVLHNGSILTLPEARSVLILLRSYGPCSLLYVTRGTMAQAGSVEAVEDGIYHGYIEAFATMDPDARNLNLPVWWSVVANAYRLWRENGGAAG